MSFIKFAHYLDADQPIYAFDPVGLNGIEAPLKTVEAMATHYINEMRAFQPEGPYRIGGKCMGGQVAFEMARQLLTQGSTVEALVILDSSGPFNGPDWNWAPPKRTLHYYAIRLQKRIATHTLHFALNAKWKKFKKSFRKRHQHLATVRKTHKIAQQQYRAAPIPQYIFLVQSAEFANSSENQRRWSALTSQGLILKVVAGSTHRSILKENEEHIHQLACYAQEYLHQLGQESAESVKTQ